MRTCATCDKPLSKQNKSGLCCPCHTRAQWADPEWRERTMAARDAAIARKLSDEAYRADLRKRAAENFMQINRRRMAWCPPRLRDAYRHLLYEKAVPAAEAREIILSQYDADLRRRRTNAA